MILHKPNLITVIATILFVGCIKKEDSKITNIGCILTVQPGIAESKSIVLQSLYPDSCYMGSSLLASIDNNTGIQNNTESLIGFDLSLIPTDAIVDSAFMQLYRYQEYYYQANAAEFLQVTESWSDKYATWQTKPKTTTYNKIAVPSGIYSKLRLNATGIVNFWIKNPTLNFGMLYRMSSEIIGASNNFSSSSHSIDSIHPKIMIHYHIASTKKCTCTDNPKPYFTVPDSIVASATIAFQPNNTNGFDTYIYSLDPTTNFNMSPKIFTGTDTTLATASEYRGLIKFDIPYLKNVIDVKSAILNLYYYNGLGTFPSDFSILPITSSWNCNAVTWNTQPSATNIGKIIIPASTPNDKIAVDITAIAKGWIYNPDSNYGIMLKIENTSNKYLRALCTSEYSISDHRPQIVIEYWYKKGVR